MPLAWCWRRLLAGGLDMAKCRAEWREVSIPGHRESFVAVVQGREIGTIARVTKSSAWSVCAGIGAGSKLVGTCYSKEGAKFMLLQAPESYWRKLPSGMPELTAANCRAATGC